MPSLPDSHGHFGEFGGKYVAETLMPALAELEKAYKEARRDPAFKRQLEHRSREFVGRPTPLYHAENLSARLGGATATQLVKVVSDSTTLGTYDPKTATVSAGQAVKWTFQDQSMQHSVTADDGSFDSCLQGAGFTFAVTFAKAGTYAYHCSIHAQMTGAVVVREGGA